MVYCLVITLVSSNNKIYHLPATGLSHKWDWSMTLVELLDNIPQLFIFYFLNTTCTWKARNHKICSNLTRNVFVKHRCPQWQQSQNMAKIFLKVLHFDPAPSPRPWDVSEVWRTHRWTNSPNSVTLYHSNFKYCTFFVSGTELWTDGLTDRRSDY